MKITFHCVQDYSLQSVRILQMAADVPTEEYVNSKRPGESKP